MKQVYLTHQHTSAIMVCVTSVNKIAERIDALSPEELKTEAEQLLADPEKFECVYATTPPSDTIKNLAPELQSLFTRFETIKQRDATIVLNRNEIAPYTLTWQETTWWRIGTKGKEILLTAPHQEDIFISKDGKLSEVTKPTYPSVYSLIAYIASD